MAEVNTTRLLRRAAKYLAQNSGGRKQTGETALGVAACQEAQVLRRIRNGANVGAPVLAKLDKFLADAGF